MSKFAKKSSDTVTKKADSKKEALWTNDPALQDQETGKTTEKGAKVKKTQDAKASDKAEKSEKTAPKKAAVKVPAKKEASKPAKAAPKKAEKAPAALDTRKITVVAKENPKRGTAAERFALYKTGMTVEKYIAAGGKQTDISWDVKQGFIKVA